MNGDKMVNETILSILIPTYNRVEKLRNMVYGLIAQVEEIGGVFLIEIIISNNASTDGTMNFLDSIKRPYIKINNNKVNLGYGGNVRWLLNNAKGTFFQILSDDDVYDDCLISEEIKMISEHKDLDYFFIPAYGTKFNYGLYKVDDYFDTVKMSFGLCCSNMFKTERARKLNVISDTWFHCELLFNMNLDFVYVSKPMITIMMPDKEDLTYWHNKPEVLIDYDTEIIKVIKKSILGEKNKEVLFLYYKKFLMDEVFVWKKCNKFQKDDSIKYSNRLNGIEILNSERKSLMDHQVKLSDSIRYYIKKYVKAIKRRIIN